MKTLRDFGIQAVFVEITNVCNMHCIFCPSDSIRRPKTFMDFDLFKKTIDQLAVLNPSLPILLHNMGEPLLHKDIFKFIDYSSSKDIKILLYTNGVKLLENMPDICKRDNIKSLVISVQTPTSETYKLRGCDKPFDQYMDDIYKAIDIFISSKSKMRVEIYLGESRKLPFRDWDILVDPREAIYIIHQMYRRITHSDRPLDYIPESLLNQMEYYYPIVVNGHHIYIRIKHFTTWANLFPVNALKEMTTEETLPSTCALANMHLAVLADGTISMCCLDIEGDMDLGNVQNDTILSALMSDKRKRIIDDANESELCRRCRGISKHVNV